jgi:hypothetical protein
MLRAIIQLLLVTLPMAAFAAQSLAPQDFVGVWVAEKPISLGERTEFQLSKDGVAKFQRHFPDAPDQAFTSESIAQVGGLQVFAFGTKDEAIMYRLVLGGWQSGSGQKRIFGTLYLYRKGQLFNGIPVAFVPK